MKKDYLILFILICFAPFVHSQDIQVRGNGNVIALNNSNQSPTENDGTSFGEVPVSRSKTHTFNLSNNTGKRIHIETITFYSSDFKTEDRGHLHNIEAGQSKDFNITFEPNSEGIKTTQVIISVGSRKNIERFTFNIKGSGISSDDADTPIMISQYYNSNRQTKIEVKNISDFDISDKEYVLAYFKSSDDLNKEPKKDQKIELKALAPGEVRVYQFKKRLLGNELIVVSTDKRKKCYDKRVDIVGEQLNWGANISLTKGACATDIPHKDFKLEYWISLSTTEVDDASVLQNIDLGKHQMGSINWNGEAWTGGRLPDRTRTVIIEGKYTNINGDIQACDLIVNDNVELNFWDGQSSNGNGNSVMVYRDLNVSDTGKFNIGNQMSLFMDDDNATITGKVRKFEKSTSLNDQYDFTYWSSPVTTASVENVFSDVRPGRIYYFDQSKSTASDPNDDPDGTFWNVWVPASGEMKPGRGYASEANNDNRHKIMFEGQPNNGIIREQVHYHDDNDEDNDFNLIGNPYPSAIDIENFFDINNAVIDEVIYLWTHSTPISEQTGDYSFDDYATYNRTGGVGVGAGPVPTKNIGSGQGFLVRAKAAGEVIFKNSIRLKKDNTEFFKMRNVKKTSTENQKDRIWLNLSTDQGGFNQLLIGFIEGATSEFDSGYDALKNQNANKIGFYSLVEENKLAIQGLGAFDSNKLIPLGFDTRVDNREYTVSIANIEGSIKDSEIILIDHQLGVSHNLKRANYIFKQDEKGSFPGRFSLSMTPQSTSVQIDEIKDENIKIFNEGDVFTVEASNDVETMVMYDIQGRVILKHHPKQRLFRVNNAKSKKGEVLYIQMIHKDQSISRKKIYKH